MKTAISIREPLLKEADELAKQLAIPRSRLIAQALEEFLERRRNLELLERINRAYSEEPDQEERDYLAAMAKMHRQDGD